MVTASLMSSCFFAAWRMWCMDERWLGEGKRNLGCDVCGFAESRRGGARVRTNGLGISLAVDVQV